MIIMDALDGYAPKRGDLVQTNIGARRERTWLILRARRMKRARSPYPRFNIWMARWWELEPEMRLALYRSAERNGGQGVVNFARYKPKRKRSMHQPGAVRHLQEII